MLLLACCQRWMRRCPLGGAGVCCPLGGGFTGGAGVCRCPVGGGFTGGAGCAVVRLVAVLQVALGCAVRWVAVYRERWHVPPSARWRLYRWHCWRLGDAEFDLTQMLAPWRSDCSLSAGMGLDRRTE